MQGSHSPSFPKSSAAQIPCNCQYRRWEVLPLGPPRTKYNASMPYQVHSTRIAHLAPGEVLYLLGEVSSLVWG